MFPANMYVIRRATERDADALRRLAAVEGRVPLSGDVLIAEKNGDIVAAMSLEDGRSVTDHVHRILDATALLRIRAHAVRALEDMPSLPRRLRAAVRAPRLSPAAAG